MIENYILKDKLNIYNNLAKSGDSLGRLSVEYNIFPAPAIFWEYETESKATDLPKYDGNGKIISPFKWNFFSIAESFLYPSDELEAHLSGGMRMTGNTARAIVGDPTITGKSFTFFLPNAKFQEVGMLGENFIVKEITHKKTKESAELVESFREGFLEANIGNEITLKMHTPIEAIAWLRRRRSIGTYITTHGEFSITSDMSIGDAADLSNDVAYMLSFANGGSIAPLVVKMHQYDFVKEYPVIYTAFAVDPIEHVASTWLDSRSDIGDLLNCFPSFQKMLQTNQWKENYGRILTWYFQAIQPLGIQLGGKPWPVVANALGAALEKLASIILVEEMKIMSNNEFNDTKIMNFENKIRKLLETIGINVVAQKYDTNDSKLGAQDAVWWFKELRNDATHSKRNQKWTSEGVNVILHNAIQWVEETLLWRLGYSGGYSDRSRGNKFLEYPRYKLNTRNSTW